MTKAKSATIVSLPRNLANLKRDSGYRWNDRDPVLAKLCEIITNSELPAYIISQKVAKIFGTPVAPTTIYNWLSGTTRKPRNDTMDRVAFALGYSRGDWTQLDAHQAVATPAPAGEK